MFTKNTSKSVMTLAAVAIATLAVSASSVHAAEIYSEDFEEIFLGDPDVINGGAAGVLTGSTWPNTDFVLSGAVNLLKPAASSSWLDPVPVALDTTFAVLFGGVTATVDMADTFDANTTYTLTFTHFRRDDQAGGSLTAKILTTGDTELKSELFAAVATTGTFVTRTLVFNTADNAAGNGLNIRLRLAFGAGGQAALDNISLDETANAAVVPTPAALPAGLAMLGLAAMRRNRK